MIILSKFSLWVMSKRSIFHVMSERSIIRDVSDVCLIMIFRFPIDPYDQYGFILQFTIEGEDLDSVAGNFHQRSQLLKTRVSIFLLISMREYFVMHIPSNGHYFLAYIL